MNEQNINSNTSNIPENTEINNPKKEWKAGSFKLDVFDWLKDLGKYPNRSRLVEVRFKNTRKEYYDNCNNLDLVQGDIIAVEASPGHDIGVVSVTGHLAVQQIRKNKIPLPPEGFKKVYRIARPIDLEKWEEAKKLEHPTMIKARQISKDLTLAMKIGDVEYQGDRTKAIFYYIDDERVDFRQLIKVLADTFKVKIEMKQIGARQEAGRIGGIGSCGKELCCAQFISKFVSVATTVAKYQEISLNPQKLAGNCGKLKCCLNFEADSYIDARHDFPDTTVQLKLKDGYAYHIKTDVYKRTMWYSCMNDGISKIQAVSVDRVKDIIQLNIKGVLPHKLEDDSIIVVKEVLPDYENIVGQESLTRFDNLKAKKKKEEKT
ncbi:MAG: hypothetical protein IPO21_13920 [Bacteroidales bacterium]|nr:hypothetical protein [Bacteroidales bacterium]